MRKHMKQEKNSPPFYRRLIAFILDLAIVNLFIFSGFSGILSSFMTEGQGIVDSYRSFLQDETMVSAMTLLSVLMSFFLISYFALSEYLAGSTIGMTVMHLSVESEDKGRPGLLQAVVRNLYCFPFFPFIVLWVLEPLFLAFRGRRLTEALTKTRTIQE